VLHLGRMTELGFDLCAALAFVERDISALSGGDR
jgi:hypothetical protein